MSLVLSLYAPKDIREAHQLFGATCGPCSLAAAVGREVCEVRDAFPTFPEKQFTNLPMMARAIRSLGLCGQKTSSWPLNGLALICGPERYHSRHWIAVHQDFVYEVSLDTWLPLLVWKRDFLPELAQSHDSCENEWRLEAGIEIRSDPHSGLPLWELGGEAGTGDFPAGSGNRQRF